MLKLYSNKKMVDFWMIESSTVIEGHGNYYKEKVN